MTKKFLHNIQYVEGIVPVDLGGGGANDGDWVSLENYQTCVVIFRSGIGTATEDPTLTMEQATSAAGAGAKPLTFTDIYVKQAATNLFAVAQYTKTVQAAAATFTNGTSAEQDLVWLLEFAAEELDRANDFVWLRARVADTGAAAQIGGLDYLLVNPRYVEAPENLVSAIA